MIEIAQRRREAGLELYADKFNLDDVLLLVVEEEQLIELRWAVQAYLLIPEQGDAKDQQHRTCVRARLQELANP